MTKTDVLDEIIEMLIKKAIEDEPPKQSLKYSSRELISRGEKENGIYSSSGYREQA
jgi:hypothetical protein